MPHLNKTVSANWVAPIAVPGFGVYFPSMGLADIPSPAIDYLESIGYVVNLEVVPLIVANDLEILKEEIALPTKRVKGTARIVEDITAVFPKEIS